jgi:hypothetical protein
LLATLQYWPIGQFASSHGGSTPVDEPSLVPDTSVVIVVVVVVSPSVVVVVAVVDPVVTPVTDPVDASPVLPSVPIVPPPSVVVGGDVVGSVVPLCPPVEPLAVTVTDVPGMVGSKEATGLLSSPHAATAASETKETIPR